MKHPMNALNSIHGAENQHSRQLTVNFLVFIWSIAQQTAPYQLAQLNGFCNHSPKNLKK